MSGTIDRVVQLYWDTNVFIAMVENDDLLSVRLGALLDLSLDGDVKIITSELTLAELLVAPLRASHEEHIQIYRDLIASGGAVDVHAVDRTILLAAARIRADHQGVRLPDAIHVATAETRGCEVFLSGDRRLPTQANCRQVALGVEALDALMADIHG